MTARTFVSILPFAVALFASAPSRPAAVEVAPDSILGTWTGTVIAPQGATGLTLAFDRDSLGRLFMTFDMPVMHCHAYRFDIPVGYDRGEYRFDALSCTWRVGGGVLRGVFGLGKLPMELHRAGTFSTPSAAPAYPPAPAVLWSYPLGAPTRATPEVRDGVVYAGALNGQMHAVRAVDGVRRWMWQGPNPIDGRVAVTATAVFFVDRRFDLVCLDRATGTLRWRTALHDSALAGTAAPENPTFNRRTVTPLVIDGAVYAGSSDGGFYAIDAATGAKRWRWDAGSPVFSTAARVGADTLAFGCMDGSVVLLDRRTGRGAVRARAGGAVVTTPVIVAGRLVVGSRDYMLDAFDAGSGAPAWAFSYWFSWVESTPAVAQGTLYVGGSDYRRVTAFDAASGRVVWATDVLGMTWGTPVVTDRTVYAATAAQNIPGTVIRHEGGIVALDRTTGAVRWRYLTPAPPENGFGGFAGSLAFDHDRLFAAGFDGTLVALPAR